MEKLQSIDQVQFVNDGPVSRKITAQDIVFNGVTVGALLHENAMGKPVKMWYQFFAPETHETMFDWSYISEDLGCIFGCIDFDNDQKMIDYVNKHRLFHFD